MSQTSSFEKQITSSLNALLIRKGYDANVENPWRAFARVGRRIYSPAVDIAVGPFATENRRYIDDYDRMVESFAPLLDKWVDMFRENWQRCIEAYYWTSLLNLALGHEDFVHGSNRNARCFLAIEVENKNSRKHLMGSIINAGALGRVGIVVAWQEEVLRAALRMKAYFDFLREAEKRTFDISGVLILTKDQLAASLEIQTG